MAISTGAGFQESETVLLPENHDALEFPLSDCIPESFNKEMIPGLVAATTVYVEAFAKPPFSEKWKLAGDDRSVHGDTTYMYNLISHLVHDESSMALSCGDGEILKTNIKGREYEIATKYPLSEIMRTYIRDILDRNSLVYIAYRDKNNKSKTANLSAGDIVSYEDMRTPTGVLRIRNFANGEKVQEGIIEEIEYYLDSEQEESLAKEISETETAYLGEIANLDPANGSWMLKSLYSYLKNFKKLPNQVVYFTKKGTSIEDTEEKDLSNNPILKILGRAYGANGMKLSCRREFDHPTRGAIVVYIFKKPSHQNEPTT